MLFELTTKQGLLTLRTSVIASSEQEAIEIADKREISKKDSDICECWVFDDLDDVYIETIETINIKRMSIDDIEIDIEIDSIEKEKGTISEYRYAYKGEANITSYSDELTIEANCDFYIPGFNTMEINNLKILSIKDDDENNYSSYYEAAKKALINYDLCELITNKL